MRGSAFTAIEVVIVAVVIVLAALFSLPFQRKSRDKSNRTKCAGNLRNLGLSAIQYSDDKRFLPHVAPLTTLDGGFRHAGATTTATYNRALLWYAYTDNPEGWICPSSLDTFRPITQTTAKGNLQTWFWGGQHGAADPRVSPFVDGLPDPAVALTDELSYGWTRKGLNRNCRSTTYLAADRSVRIESEHDSGATLDPGEVGNHSDGWSVLFADASVQWFQVDADIPDSTRPGPVHPADLLTGTSAPYHGYLALRDQRPTLGAPGS